MVRLLVSVRNSQEAHAAIRGGAQMLDIKEPSRGSLGAALPGVQREIVETFGDRLPCSIALGELRDLALDTVAVPRGCAYVKVGLAGMRGEDWTLSLAKVRRRLPPRCRLVAVVYADWRTAEAPPPEQILQWAVHCPIGAVLFDTFGKDGTLFRWVDGGQMRAWIEQVHRAGLLAVVAGSLNEHVLADALETGTDVIAVRGAVCEGDRTASISAVRVARLAHALRSFRSVPATT